MYVNAFSVFMFGAIVGFCAGMLFTVIFALIYGSKK